MLVYMLIMLVFILIMLAFMPTMLAMLISALSVGRVIFGPQIILSLMR